MENTIIIKFQSSHTDIILSNDSNL